jgi:nucleoside phosphorylase
MTPDEDAAQSNNSLDSSLPASSDATLPDISGEWTMNIHWHRGERAGKVTASAIIRQDFGRISMEVHSKGSDSHTLLAQLGREKSGSPVLHYLYEVEPKAIASDAEGPYKGAAILRFYSASEALRGNYWTSQLTKGHFELTRKTKTRNTAPKTDAVDVVLVTAIREEFDAAKSTFSAASISGDGVREWNDQKTISSAPHEVGVFFRNNVPLFVVAIAKPTRMGANRTGHVATVLVERLQPKCLVMCGVCAGNPGDLALGDTVVSELTYQYDEGKLEADGFVGDHRQSPISQRWLRAAETLKAEELSSYGRPTAQDARYWLLERLLGGDNPRNHPARNRYFGAGEWQTAIGELEKQGLLSIEGSVLRLTAAGKAEVERSIVMDVDPPLTLPLAIKTGPIASGNVVVKDGLTWDKLKRMGVRTVLGLEMEAAAIGEVARASGVEEWVVIKGVMDHADPKKDDRFKPFAARASAEALRAFLVDRFGEIAEDSRSGKGPSGSPAASTPSGWRPRTVEGRFYDDLSAAIERHAPRFKGLLQLALEKAKEARSAAEQAYEISEQVRVALGGAIAKTHAGRPNKGYKILKVENGSKASARPLIAKIWNSHDEYSGEAAGNEADGLGVLRLYLVSEEITPSLRSSYAGMHEAGRYGPLGVYTFPDQEQFAGQWTGGHPSLGYREFIGDSSKLQCDFYLGYLNSTSDKFQPLWRPHGEGIAVDASLRRGRCGILVDGVFDHISSDYSF